MPHENTVWHRLKKTSLIFEFAYYGKKNLCTVNYWKNYDDCFCTTTSLNILFELPFISTCMLKKQTPI